MVLTTPNRLNYMYPSDTYFVRVGVELGSFTSDLGSKHMFGFIFWYKCR